MKDLLFEMAEIPEFYSLYLPACVEATLGYHPDIPFFRAIGHAWFGDRQDSPGEV
ncbi:hypothetical protein IJ22_12370 [Paenibacillus naphthalenovorans]|uniref:Uncharacterized protein n=1 Tax=Paenibacillus naphthalenovorans TaxID=162209 RepID=A0A0U2W2I7_9BACL|nr:hypothetical protein IJ22_12370 [Paenibacillus naphthalenovorans]